MYKAKINGFVIEGSQYGDLLAVSNSTYKQGTPTSSSCGQSTVFGFQQIYPENSSPRLLQIQEVADNPDNFSIGKFTVEKVWTYRRLLGKGNTINPGEISLQNWDGPGNDYRAGYLFATAQPTVYNWQGGLNSTTVKQAELRSLRFHSWFA